MNRTNTIDRISQMELYFDTLQKAFEEDPSSLLTSPLLSEMLQHLIQYYESKDWLEDFECDERGELPSELKRGVLSEDGLYNFLSDLNAYYK